MENHPTGGKQRNKKGDAKSGLGGIGRETIERTKHVTHLLGRALGCGPTLS